MENKKSIVFVSHLDMRGSGYFNIATPLCSELVKRGNFVKVIGLGYTGVQHNYPISIIPAGSMEHVMAMLQNLYTVYKYDALVVAFDITVQMDLINRLKQQPFKYVGIMPVESNPLCMSWAMQLSKVDKPLIISRFGTEEAKSAGVYRAEYFPISIDTDFWKSPTQEERKKYRDFFGFTDETFAVLTVADNQERKNLWKSMEMFAEFSKDKSDARYILVTRKDSFVGWKLDDLAVDLGISNKLMLFERGMTASELWKLYAISNTFLLASKAEGLGLPVLEAMACEIPCIGTNCTGIKENLSDNRGLLIDYDYQYVDPFGNSVRYCASKEHGIQLLNGVYNKTNLPDVSAAREYVKEFTVEKSADVFEKYLEDVCNAE